jgi:DNA-directed RNA polymerase subunit M/transcription elongation factor TFIIS
MDYKCPKCGIKVIIERGLYIRPAKEEKEIKAGKAIRIVQGCEAQNWSSVVHCYKCGTYLLEKDRKLEVLPQKTINCPKCGKRTNVLKVKPLFETCFNCKAVLKYQKGEWKISDFKELLSHSSSSDSQKAK